MDTVAELDAVWRGWAQAGETLTEQQWHGPTRLPGWTVGDLFAHHSGFPAAILAVCSAPEADAPLTHPDAPALLAMFNRPGGPAHTMADMVRDHAIEQARQHPRTELVHRFTDIAPQALELARSIDPRQRVNYGGVAVMAFGEALRIGLMEAVVHYVDLAHAADLPLPGPLEGAPLRATAALLTEVADPLAFVERATGRSTEEVLPVIR